MRRGHHADKENALGDLDGLKADHFVKIRPHIKLKQKQNGDHKTDGVNVLRGFQHCLILEGKRRIDSF